VLTNRTIEKARALASEFNGRVAPFETWTEELSHSDIVITSTSAPEAILDRTRLAPVMKVRRSRPLLLIDIAVPRDIAPDVAGMDDVYLYDVDDLQHIADDYLEQRKGELERCEGILRAKAADLLDARIPPNPAGASRSPALNA
jgi:glutamyl-tRNA reductase